MAVSKLIDFESYPISPVLDRLLQDKTTKQNIIFATDAYLETVPISRKRRKSP